MPETRKPFYLTTPIYYVNARPHIGHAYTTIVADVLARRHRLLGEDVYFLTGTDEHGQKIERSAAAAGIPPQQFADQVSKTFSDLFTRMGITNDQFIRTTSEKHIRGAQHLFAELYKNGHIYLDSYTGAYCVSDEAFVDAPIGTPCPDCGKLLEEVTEENFFFRLSAFQLPLLDLIESNQLTITPDSARNEVLNFLRGNVASVLAEAAQNLSSRPERSAVERPAGGTAMVAMSTAGNPYVMGALRDLSVSRSSFTWGIPVPEPAASASKQKHVIYVWLDALANYMTALGYGSEGFEDPGSLFNKFWPADLHLVGKEITRFHCIYWPAFLMAANLPTPKAITANGWLLFDNAKMSKSKGNVVRTETILEAFGTLCPPPLPPTPKSVILSEGAEPHPAPQSKDPEGPTPATEESTLPATIGYPTNESATNAGSAGPGTIGYPEASASGLITQPENGALAPEVCLPSKQQRDLFATDILRYHLLREIPFGQDGSFSFDAMITRYNADLANGYGNLVSRVLKMISTYCSGIIPNALDTLVPGDVEVNYETQTAKSIHSSKTIKLYANKASTVVSEKFVTLTFAGGGQGELASAATTWGILDSISSLITHTDLFLTQHAPWKLASNSLESNREQIDAILFTAAQSIRIITALLCPILPFTTAKVWAQLGLGDIELAARNGELTNLQWGGLQPGTKLGPLAPIFPRADKGLAQIMSTHEEKLATGNWQLETESQNPPSPPATQPPPTTSPAAGPRTSTIPTPTGPLTVAGSSAHTTGPDPIATHSGPLALNPEPSPSITIDDFAKIELRVAEITLAERIPKADKLLRLEVNLGPFGTRQILSGIAEFYTPEELIGRRIVVITNLAPRKMRGLESHGMLLAASDPDAGDHGKPHLATCGPDIPLGSRLK